jgi:putative addiction module component (TIGR02574 family)
MDQAILEREALRLPAHERALLADALLGSLDDEAAREVESAWAQEAEGRLAAYHRGEITTLEGPAVLRELRGRYTK